MLCLILLRSAGGCVCGLRNTCYQQNKLHFLWWTSYAILIDWKMAIIDSNLVKFLKKEFNRLAGISVLASCCKLILTLTPPDLQSPFHLMVFKLIVLHYHCSFHLYLSTCYSLIHTHIYFVLLLMTFVPLLSRAYLYPTTLSSTCSLFSLQITSSAVSYSMKTPAWPHMSTSPSIS